MPSEQFSRRELNICLVFGLVLLASGFIAALLVPESGGVADYWHGYKVCGRGVGWLSFLTGLVWTGLTLGHMMTDFFNLKKVIRSDEYVITLIVIAVASLVLAVWASGKIIIVPDASLIRNEDFALQSCVISEYQNGLRVLTQWAILLAGASLAAFPTVRFFRNQ